MLSYSHLVFFEIFLEVNINTLIRLNINAVLQKPDDDDEAGVSEYIPLSSLGGSTRVLPGAVVSRGPSPPGPGAI